MPGFQAQHGGPPIMGLSGMANVIFPITGLFFALVFKPQTVGGPARPTLTSKVFDTLSIVWINGSALLVNLPFGFMSWSGFSVSIGCMYAGLLVTLLADFCFLYTHLSRASSWNWERDPTKRTLCTTGPYRLCRHPLYWCFFLYIVGMILLTGSWFFCSALLLNLCVALWHIEDEEVLMRNHFGDEYQQYCERTSRWGVGRIDKKGADQLANRKNDSSVVGRV